MFPEVNWIVAALLLLPPSAQFRIANGIRAPQDYLFARYLPEVGKPSYVATSGNMTVHATMAGLTGLSSNYPPGGFIRAATINEKTAKVANHVELQEEDLRSLQDMVARLQLNGNSDLVLVDYVVDVLLNFFDKMVLQGHLDTAEWLRGQALCEGKIDWTSFGIRLEVDYNVPAANKLANRAGNDAYGGSASKFWPDIRDIQTILNNNVRAIVMHPTTFNVAAANPVNGIEILGQTGNVYRVRRIIETGAGNDRISTDSRDTLLIETYGLEATKIKPDDPRATVNVPFIRKGRILGIGNPISTRLDIGIESVGQGSTPDPNLGLAVGYTHIAPTVEGGGRIGRWGRTFTPEERPWAIVGQGVTNIIPVVDNPEVIATASSDMP